MTSITTSKAITTSKDVWDVAKTKKTTTKLNKVASGWGLEYIDMYNECIVEGSQPKPTVRTRTYIIQYTSPHALS